MQSVGILMDFVNSDEKSLKATKNRFCYLSLSGFSVIFYQDQVAVDDASGNEDAFAVV